MSNKPFNETARDLKLDEAAEENDDYILCGELQNDEGEWVAAEINLMKSLGCLNRLPTWSGVAKTSRNQRTVSSSVSILFLFRRVKTTFTASCRKDPCCP
ncbi:hypothetical protein AFLA_003501 [Aspergillus flavus NRRL3357]|nr:hypothetical protein AFLA_003501 [Aspergillus flavus NRRL3357]